MPFLGTGDNSEMESLSLGHEANEVQSGDEVSVDDTKFKAHLI
jgi:hypothetical protein